MKNAIDEEVKRAKIEAKEILKWLETLSDAELRVALFDQPKRSK